MFFGKVDHLFSFQYRRFLLSFPPPGRMHVVVNSDLVPIFVWVPLLHRCIVEVVHKSRMPDQELYDFHYIAVIVVILSVRCLVRPKVHGNCSFTKAVSGNAVKNFLKLREPLFGITKTTELLKGSKIFVLEKAIDVPLTAFGLHESMSQAIIYKEQGFLTGLLLRRQPLGPRDPKLVSGRI
jgi:hypothetical protein